MLTMIRTMICLLASMVCAQAYSAPVYFSWGQVQGRGFAFVGKPERFRDLCIAFMEANRIFNVRDIRLNGVESTFETQLPSPTVCRRILEAGRDLGSNEAQMSVAARLRQIDLTYVGKTSSIVDRCRRDLEAASIVSTRDLEIGGVPLDVSLLKGDEICGEIAAHAVLLPRAYDLYRAAGQITRKPFSFVGHFEGFAEQCRLFLIAEGIARAREITIDGVRHRFTQDLEESRICDAAFGLATLIERPFTYYYAAGEAGRQRFWFAGKPEQFLSSCAAWMRANDIGAVNTLIVEGQRVETPVALFGVGACGVIFSRSMPEDGRAHLIDATGRVGTEPFGWVGRPNKVATSCEAFMRSIGVSSAGTIRLNGRQISLGHDLPPPLLCDFIVRHATRLPFPYDILSLDGRISTSELWFTGLIDQAYDQCTKQLQRDGIQFVQAFEADGVSYRLDHALPVAEGCMAMLSHAGSVPEKSFAVMYGQVKDQGFAWAGFKTEIVKTDCVEFLQRRGISSTDKFTVMDEVVTRAVPWATPGQICDEIEKKIAKHRVLPDIAATGMLAGEAYAFEGRADIALEACRAYVTERQINRVTEVEVNGVVHVPTNAFWEGDEVCGVIVAKS